MCPSAVAVVDVGGAEVVPVGGGTPDPRPVVVGGDDTEVGVTGSTSSSSVTVCDGRTHCTTRDWVPGGRSGTVRGVEKAPSLSTAVAVASPSVRATDCPSPQAPPSTGHRVPGRGRG